MMQGLIKPDASADPDYVKQAMYMGPVMPWIDPQKEAEGWKTLVRSGFADQSEVIRARGRDPMELLNQRQMEVEENTDRGLVFDSDPGQDKGSAPAPAVTEAGDTGGSEDDQPREE